MFKTLINKKENMVYNIKQSINSEVYYIIFHNEKRAFNFDSIKLQKLLLKRELWNYI